MHDQGRSTCRSKVKPVPGLFLTLLQSLVIIKLLNGTSSLKCWPNFLINNVSKTFDAEARYFCDESVFKYNLSLAKYTACR